MDSLHSDEIINNNEMPEAQDLTNTTPNDVEPSAPESLKAYVPRAQNTNDGSKPNTSKATGILAAISQYSFVIAAILLVRNIASTISSMGNGAGFFELFFITTGSDGTVNPLLVLYVWGPFVFAGIGLLAMLFGSHTQDN